MMQRTTQVRETIEDAETRLWSMYVLAMSRCQGIEAKYYAAWREYVISDGDPVWHKRWRELAEEWQDATRQAHAAVLAWKRVAYPQHGMSVQEDESSS
jgi:hypothetical protein